MNPELGIIEGYFGRPWTWADREATIRALAPLGYGFFLYAPKADASLRRAWREPTPPRTLDALSSLGRHCAVLGVRFGIGLTPFGGNAGFDAGMRAALSDKLAELDATGIGELAILFDDMDGGQAGLADRQAAIVDFIAARTAATRLSVCPSYYSDDPLLDRAFGARPARYLETLAAGIDARIALFWTGEEVCAREVSPGHLEEVAERIGRLPTLWDNYPVNDGPTMSQRLHLRGFTGRPAANGPRLRAHAVNPALQPTLSRIPMRTLVDAYREGDAYCYRAATDRALAAELGDGLAAAVRLDLKWLQDTGLDRLGAAERAELRARYAAYEQPGAREIVDWLDGAYAIAGEAVRTQ